MNPARVVRLTPAEAMRCGARMGADAALVGHEPQPLIDSVCARGFWRVQSEEIRRSFAWALTHAYVEKTYRLERGT